VRMEGWRQRRLGSKEDHSTTKGNYKTDLTLTGLLMEGLGARCDVVWAPRITYGLPTIRELVGSVNTMALQGVYPAFPVTGGIRQHRRV
jgi:hypothetical protein